MFEFDHISDSSLIIYLSLPILSVLECHTFNRFNITLRLQLGYYVKVCFAFNDKILCIELLPFKGVPLNLCQNMLHYTCHYTVHNISIR